MVGSSANMVVVGRWWRRWFWRGDDMEIGSGEGASSRSEDEDEDVDEGEVAFKVRVCHRPLAGSARHW